MGKMGWPWTEESPRLPNSMPDGDARPRVSIVTPSYNQSEFIEETIRSVLLQGYPDLEYIIMDGGSTDGSVDIIRKYEPWLTHWVSQPDHGQTDAINKGWEFATGQILAYINSDDCYLASTVPVAANAFFANPMASMIYGTAIIVDETGKELRVWRGRPFDLETMLTIGSVVPQPATFFTKDALKSLGYLDKQWHMIMDYELCIRMGLKFRAIYLPRTLAKFRDHSKSKTHAYFDMMTTELICWLENFAPEQVSPNKLRVLKSKTLSRVHYECALSYLAKGHEYALKALLELIKSIFQYPLFALKRPMGTAYIIKEIFRSQIPMIQARLSTQNRKQQAKR